ncbi:MAG: ribonuclease Y [Candidatus Dependentiae bacterium]|jgi:ribonuclease Y
MLPFDPLSLLLGFSTSVILYPAFLAIRRYRSGKAEVTGRQLLLQMHHEVDRRRHDALSALDTELERRRDEGELQLKKTQVELDRLQHSFKEKENVLREREVQLHSQQERQQERERGLSLKSDRLDAEQQKLKSLYADLVRKLEVVANLSQDEARKMLSESLESEVRLDRQQWLAKVEDETRLTAKERATDIIATSMQRYLADMVTMHSSGVVSLPNEEMKGRIIGKEGRNIKALEVATGMEFVIGDAPESLTISGFNPLRREVAKRALQKLIQDGRINPTRIEETVEQCEQELDQTIEEEGKQAVLEFGLPSVHPEIVTLLGKLHFRTSYTQNVLIHSKEVAHFARMVAAELGLDPLIAARCGLFHDIGKAVSAEVEGPHAIVGADLAKEYGENSIVVNAIAAHHNEVPIRSTYDVITQIADTISAARPGARRETLSTYIKRLEHLEAICEKFQGVKKSYALQAGREVRIIVDEHNHNDESALILARDIAKKIEGEMNFPGQIKVSVIRETRAIEYAK